MSRWHGGHLLPPESRRRWPARAQALTLYPPQDAVTALLARTTAQLQAVERELAEERVKLECAEDEILELGRKEELAEAVSERYRRRPIGRALSRRRALCRGGAPQ